MGKARKKPVEIEFVRWNGHKISDVPSWVSEALTSPMGKPGGIMRIGNEVYIETLEGTMIASPGDVIIKGVNGEIYPCKPDIFEKTYEVIEE
jgi:hypothetical protein